MAQYARVVLIPCCCNGHVTCCLCCRRAKYTLQTLVRTIDTTTRGYGCVMEIEDPDKIRGVKLSRDLMKVSGGCLTSNHAFIFTFCLVECPHA